MIELIIVVVIFGIVASFALPGFQIFIAGSKISATTNNFVSSIYVARSEAVKRGEKAGICPSFNPSDQEARCAPGATWTDGWIAFVDDDEDGSRSLGSPAEDLLVQSQALTAGFTVSPDTQFTDRIYFAENGTSITTGGIPMSGVVTIRFGADDAREINISANGRVSSKVVP